MVDIIFEQIRWQLTPHVITCNCRLRLICIYSHQSGVSIGSRISVWSLIPVERVLRGPSLLLCLIYNVKGFQDVRRTRQVLKGEGGRIVQNNLDKPPSPTKRQLIIIHENLNPRNVHFYSFNFTSVFLQAPKKVGGGDNSTLIHFLYPRPPFWRSAYCFKLLLSVCLPVCRSVH